MKNKKLLIGVILVVLVIIGVLCFFLFRRKTNIKSYDINISNKTYSYDGQVLDIKRYTKNDYETFLNDFKKGNLDDLYITEFLFDGVGMYKTYDLDDFKELGNDMEVKPLNITVFNVIKEGNYTFAGEIVGGMIAINSNNLKGDVNIILSGVKLDTDSKKIPAIYVYNKDITYTKHKVTIKTEEDTTNYIAGGKFKKVSMIPSDELEEYTNKYSGDTKTWYNSYTNYYGVYTKDEINNILFAKVEADAEDLRDGDPYYFYKGAGAISSDIDLYFDGVGEIVVTSKNKEGIESKGNIEFMGGTGDYFITAYDDCINTTTSKNVKNARNTITINVSSLTAMVSLNADEGDAIDSNGSLIINGGDIIALAKPGSDSGLDSELGTTINAGKILATGDMLDTINSNSKQKFITLSFDGSIQKNTLIALLDSADKVTFTYKTDRPYKYLVYSDDTLDGTYYLYKDGSIISDDGDVYGLQKGVIYTKGDMLGYSNTGNMGEAGRPNNRNLNGEPPKDRPEMPNERAGLTGTASNKEFKISGTANIFSGITKYEG